MITVVEPAPARRPAWPHQLACATWNVATRRGIDQVGMGCGKTRITVESVEDLGAGVVVVLAPKSVVPHWGRQLAEWAQKRWRLCLLRGASVADYLEELRRAVAQSRADRLPLLVVVNYESAWRAPLAKALEWLAGLPGAVVIFDECQKLKSHDSTTSRWAAQLARPATAVLGLSGTMMMKYPPDVWAELRAIRPGVLQPTWTQFKARYTVWTIGQTGIPRVARYLHLDELGAKLRACVYVVPSTVLDLPECVPQVVPIELSKPARRAYLDMRDELRARVQTGELHARNAAVALLRLTQITGGTMPLDGGGAEVVDRGKEEWLADALRATDQPVVAFARYHSDLDACHRAAAAAGVGSLELSGRRDQLEDWQGGESQLLAVQLQAGSIGVDLTRAAFGVFYSPGWQLGEYDQAVKRLHRPPQQRVTRIYHLVATQTVDEAIYGAHAKSRQAIDEVLRYVAGDGSVAELDEPEVRR